MKTPIEKLRNLLESKGIYKEAISLMKEYRESTTLRENPSNIKTLLHSKWGGYKEFVNAYIEAMFFTENEELGDAGINEIAPEFMRQIKIDCIDFCNKAGPHDIEEYGWVNAGHDFWFTRNGHGVGFWENDHATPEICKRLDSIATSFGEAYVELGDDGKIYGN